MDLVSVSEWKDPLPSFRGLRDSDAGHGINRPSITRPITFVVFIKYMKLSMINIFFFWVDLGHFVTKSYRSLYIREFDILRLGRPFVNMSPE